MILCRRASVKCSTFCAGFFYAHKDMAAAFPNFLALRRYVVIVLRHGKWQPFFCLKAKQSQRMKKTTPGTTYVPSFRSTQNVNTLQERYFRSLSDCQVKTSSDAYYVSVIACICLTFIFPPCVLAAGYCLYKAKKGGKA